MNLFTILYGYLLLILGYAKYGVLVFTQLLTISSNCL